MSNLSRKSIRDEHNLITHEGCVISVGGLAYLVNSALSSSREFDIVDWKAFFDEENIKLVSGFDLRS